MSKGESAMYDDVCKGQFDSVRTEIASVKEEVQKVFNRLFVTNGNRPLVEEVRDAKESSKRTEAKLNEHVDSNHEGSSKKLSLFGIINCEGFEVRDIARIAAIVGIAFLVFHIFKMNETVHSLRKDLAVVTEIKEDVNEEINM